MGTIKYEKIKFIESQNNSGWQDHWRLCDPKIQYTYGDSSLIKGVKLIVKDGFTVYEE